MQLFVLEVVYALVHSPVRWDLFDFYNTTQYALPQVVVVHTLPKFGWYLVGDCSHGVLAKGTERIQSQVAGLCLEGPFSQLYRVRSRMKGHAPLKFGYRPLYIY